MLLVEIIGKFPIQVFSKCSGHVVYLNTLTLLLQCVLLHLSDPTYITTYTNTTFIWALKTVIKFNLSFDASLSPRMERPRHSNTKNNSIVLSYTYLY